MVSRSEMRVDRTSFALAIVAAAALRATGLTYSVPCHFHVDEQLLFTTTADLARDPQKAVAQKYFFNYGSLPRTLLLPPLVAAHRAGRLNLDSRRQLVAYYVVGRGVSAVFGVLTVALVWLIGERHLGPGVGTAAALLLAFSPLHVRDSHFFTPDVMLTFFMTASCAACVTLSARPGARRAILAGVLGGLTLATKASGVAGLLPLLVAARRLRTKRLMAAGALALVATALLGNWPALLAPDRLFSGVREFSVWVVGARVRQPDLQFVGTRPWAFWITNLLRFGAGPVLMAVGLAGLVVVARRARSSTGGRMLLAMGVPYFLIVGAAFQKFMRFSLPLHPFLALCGGVLMVEAYRRRRVRPLVILLFLLHAGYGIAYAKVFWHTDPRIAAGRELSHDLPGGTAILLETTHSNPPLIDADRKRGLYDSYLPKLGECVVSRYGEFTLHYIDPYVHLYEVAQESNEQWACVDSALSLADVVVLGPRYRDQYLRLPDQFPAMNRFYRGLDSGSLGFRLARVYRNPPSILGITIDDRDSELTFRLFDRPAIRVYVRSDSEAEEALCAPASQ